MIKSKYVASEGMHGDKSLNQVKVELRLCTGTENRCCIQCLPIVREWLQLTNKIECHIYSLKLKLLLMSNFQYDPILVPS